MFKYMINTVINNDVVQAFVEGAGKGLEIGGKIVVGTAAVTAPLLVPGGQAKQVAKLAVKGAGYIAAGKGIQKGVDKIQGSDGKRKQDRKSDVDPELVELCTEEVVELLARGKRDEAIQMIFDDMYTNMWFDDLRRINARNFVDKVQATYMDIIEEKFMKYNNISK